MKAQNIYLTKFHFFITVKNTIIYKLLSHIVIYIKFIVGNKDIRRCTCTHAHK
jgi:hypothetical protein